MADASAWPSIQRHGLLSTAALLDEFEASQSILDAALGGVRRDTIHLSHPLHGEAVIRDQAPLKFLDVCLTPGATVQDFLNSLNHRVFFWATPARLERLLGARRYRRGRHVIMHVDTASLVARYGSTIELAPYNTGSVHVPNAPARGPEVYQRIGDYPYATWAAKRGRNQDAVVEVTVANAVPDIFDHLTQVEVVDDGQRRDLPSDDPRCSPL